MAAWLLVLLIACPKGRSDAQMRLNAWLRAADVAWADRGNRGLQEAAKPLMRAWQDFPTHPEVLWRLVRLKVAEGLVAEDEREALRLYADGRSIGLQCLDGDPAFAQQRAQGNWDQAVDDLEPAREPCVAWTGLAWTRWIAVQGGAAAALDLERVDALVADAQASPVPALQSVGIWARGILTAVRPSYTGGDPVAARSQLEKAVDADPDALVRRADLLLLAAPEDALELRQSILSRPADTPEDVRARERVEAWTP